MALDLEDFNFLSLGSKDRVVYRLASSRSVSGSGFDQFSIAHGVTIPFAPVLRFSVDGGTTWYYSGDIYASGSVSVRAHAEANNTDLRITILNQPTARTVHYEIYGIARDV